MPFKNYLIYKIHDELLRGSVKSYARGRLIHIGCGESYTLMIKRYATEHIDADDNNTLHDKSKIYLFGTAYSIPVGNKHFDTVLCTAVLEHLKEPDKAIKEANRVSERGDYAIYIVPLYWRLHEEPRDFYRYTKYGLKYLFEKIKAINKGFPK